MRKFHFCTIFVGEIFSLFHSRECPCTGIAWWGRIKGKDSMKSKHEEILKQRDLLDVILASRTNQYDKIQNMELMDSIYFKKNLPENVVLFPLQRIKRYVHNTTKQPNKNSKKV